MICRYFPTICAHVRGVFSAEPYLLLRLGIQQVLGQRFSAYYKNDLEKLTFLYMAIIAVYTAFLLGNMRFKRLVSHW